MSIEWEWGYYGKCFINNKFSHGVRLVVNQDSVDASYWNTCLEPTGVMLGTIDRTKTLEEMVKMAEAESLQTATMGFKDLTERRKKLQEYPYHPINIKSNSPKSEDIKKFFELKLVDRNIILLTYSESLDILKAGVDKYAKENHDKAVMVGNIYTEVLNAKIKQDIKIPDIKDFIK